MKASIVFTVLNSHEIVRRQLLYFEQMPLPNETEVVLIDDGSQPPLAVGPTSFPLLVHRTHDPRPWTQARARLAGIERATSPRVICVDIDHVVTPELIQFMMDSQYDFIKFRRQLAVLDEYGTLRPDRALVHSYGVPQERLKRRGLTVCPPGNCYGASKAFLLTLIADPANHTVRLPHLLKVLKRTHGVSMCGEDERPMIYCIPNGRFCGDDDANPFGLFHGLSRTMEAYKVDYWISR